jgi:predicted AlkP superfamily phosphohydrolase/phosphomutase
MLLRKSISDFRAGFLFFYFSSVDQNSHMLWGRYDNELLNVYREIDECIGEVRRKLPGTDLIVMSDHGFSNFDRAAHLNAWLSHRGFLTLRGEPGDNTGLNSIDWGGTEAYALGLNGLYLNQKGREAHGIVAAGAGREGTLANLREQLLQWRDPVTGRPVVSSIALTAPRSGNAGVAPDLIVGYSPGYRGSWQTGVGATPALELEDNADEWIADHCIDPNAVPGVLFLSRKKELNKPQIADIPASILHHFGIESKARSH